jgi:hypothetical protein
MTWPMGSVWYPVGSTGSVGVFHTCATASGSTLSMTPESTVPPFHPMFRGHNNQGQGKQDKKSTFLETLVREETTTAMTRSTKTTTMMSIF